ncbi:MAG: hypothetical protein GTN49_00370 [candidate division Zixibacteria bacterium]|nr:hypothetical protein [candidate division Zixibacteria bacterium]
MNIFEKFLYIDRRWIFILVALAVAVPLVFPLGLAVTTSPPVENVYNEIESLKPGTPVLISVDYDPATQPELGPMTIALLRHCIARKLPVIVTVLVPGGPGLAVDITSKVAEEMGAQRDVDYTLLGYKVGVSAVILSLGQDFRISYPRDYYNTPLDEIPLMKNVKNYNDVGLVVSISGTVIPEYWVAYAHERYGQKVAAGVTAVMAADFYPYLQTGQLVGLVGGLKGAAEYEKLIDRPADGLKGMDAQTIVHLLIVVFIILGNVAYIFMRRAKKRSEASAR